MGAEFGCWLATEGGNNGIQDTAAAEAAAEAAAAAWVSRRAKAHIRVRADIIGHARINM